MGDIIYLVLISRILNIIEVSELRLQYDEDYKEDMYIGVNDLGLCGYLIGDVLDDMALPESQDFNSYYFTESLKDVYRELENGMNLKYHKLL